MTKNEYSDTKVILGWVKWLSQLLRDFLPTLGDTKGPENIISTMMMYGRRCTATTRHNTSCSEDKYILIGKILWKQGLHPKQKGLWATKLNSTPVIIAITCFSTGMMINAW